MLTMKTISQKCNRRKRQESKTTGTNSTQRESISLQFQNAIQAKAIDGQQQKPISRYFQNTIQAKAIDGQRQEPIPRK